ncbi:RNB domain-containing ribonuclease [Pseudohaliea rubra]|nr:RNB domain-containing ribonuclease [Pseudohaliea rubra]
MLDRDALSQLRGLKKEMESVKERVEAVVKGTQARYGFAVLDDGREVFVPPDEMLKAFPGDRVRVCVRPGADDRPVAEIERLVDSPLGEFNGQCVRKGKALFVRPQLATLQRWLFLPPHARNGVKEGDYVRCAVLRHPIRDGRPQAKVLRVFGPAGTPGLENQFAMARHGVRTGWESTRERELSEQLKTRDPLADSHRLDLTDLAFVSIDSARTQDIDDALYAETTTDGWILYVAIADPTAYVGADSPLLPVVTARACSAYFHGDVVPMLPEALAQESCALTEDQTRPALVCKLAVADSGEIRDFEFHEAIVRSRAKLSYFAVDKYLSGEQDSLMSYASPLEALYAVYRALAGNREAEGLTMEERREHRWQLDDSGQIEQIEPGEKLNSQRLVEACMIAANRCAARFLAEHNASGPYISHPGFRRDRSDETRQFLERNLPALKEADPHTLEGYRAIFRALTTPESDLPLRAMINRLLTRATLSTKPAPHMGMVLPVYTTCTSPLRRAVDFLVHLQLKAILHERKPDLVHGPTLERVGAGLRAVRAATADAERWLAANFLEKRAAADPAPWPARIVHLSSSGFVARIDAWGLEGFVDLRKDPEKFSYDKWQATLTSKTRRFQLEAPVAVTLAGIDREGDHLARFLPAPGEGAL